jgi:hypothetical protein
MKYVQTDPRQDLCAETGCDTGAEAESHLYSIHDVYAVKMCRRGSHESLILYWLLAVRLSVTAERQSIEYPSAVRSVITGTGSPCNLDHLTLNEYNIPPNRTISIKLSSLTYVV